MNSMKPILAAAAASLLQAGAALATPTLYPNDLNVLTRINNPTNSNLIGDDAVPTTVYVMPPNEGTGSMSGIHSVSGTVELCDNFPELDKEAMSLTKESTALAVELGKSAKQLADFDKRIEAAQQDAATFATANHVQDLVQLDGQISALQARIDADGASYDSCTGDKCAFLMKEIGDLQKQETTLMTARNQFVAKNLAASRIYDQKKAAADAIVAQKASFAENYKTLRTSLDDAAKEIRGLFDEYGRMYGARAAFTYKSGWNENVDALRKANPGYNFAPLNTENVVLYPQLKGIPGLSGDYVLGMDVNGDAPASGRAGIAFPAFPPSLQGNVILSLIGTCPMVRPDLFKGTGNFFDPKNMKYGLVATYQFPSVMKLQMKATYNMHMMYQKVVEMHTRGGLFSSRSWTTVDERKYFNDAFRVDWNSQDPGNMISDEQRIQMERDARADLYSRLLGIGAGGVSSAAQLQGAPTLPDHGSVVLADSLMKACPGNAYCMAGSLVLTALDSIFGSSDTSQALTQTADVDQAEEWNMNKVVMKPWITSYQVQ